MSYQLYRSMSLGESLQAALDDLITNGIISPELAAKASARIKCNLFIFYITCRYSNSMTAV